MNATLIISGQGERYPFPAKPAIPRSLTGRYQNGQGTTERGTQSEQAAQPGKHPCSNRCKTPSWHTHTHRLWDSQTAGTGGLYHKKNTEPRKSKVCETKRILWLRTEQNSTTESLKIKWPMGPQPLNLGQDLGGNNKRPNIVSLEFKTERRLS